MPGSVTIPLVTLPVGTRNFGPAALADFDSEAELAIDRTPANGFNAQPATTTMKIAVEQSNDGGGSWFEKASEMIVGGVYSGKGTDTNTSTVWVDLAPGTGRQVRATLTVAGAPVAVRGSLTLT